MKANKKNIDGKKGKNHDGTQIYNVKIINKTF